MSIRCAIVGCGLVAEEYARTLKASSLVDLVSCSDIEAERAQAFAARHAIGEVASVDELDTELVVVLTPPALHVEVASAAIRAGMSVYIEKPLALSSSDAASLLALAADHGVLVGAAPDTFLAPPVQSAAQALATGLIGEPVAATAALLSPGPERWHPHPEPIYDLGPLLDMGPYYLTALIHLLNPITSVRGATTAIRPLRTKASGDTFTATAPTHVDALLQTADGVSVTVTTSFDVQGTTRPHLEVYGTEGTLVLPDPNFHHGVVRLRRRGEVTWDFLAPALSRFDVIGRGMGVLDLAGTLCGGGRGQATGDLALHVLQVIEAIGWAAATGTCQAVPNAAVTAARAKGPAR
ncbi:Gfo/Idh/MocA family oxidoreductase [Planotetraspora sp. A-T 1434]|uniref:Gfo/Idh/MocA family protein n=1 Tax=Planotetraspora sp. A-T 1434 TaxID=2979219 RepID=UPI0021BE2786|nr:Gfo/Idh/MocA family oxidoreductase [Planotetraspora sp. A-T 1434]MCT9934939.1 Gfo/Idh/MocA family oxidoreductase [Planotetraspora sp. A-T 1434]